jgi:hypothetical protein
MRSVDLELLRAHNPVPDPEASVDRTAEATAFERAMASIESPPDSRSPRRQRARWPLAAVIAPLVRAGAALAASSILSGAPYDPPWAHNQPTVDLGIPVRGTAQLLPLRVEDAAGGPPWGLRVVRTTRGYECVELGRVVNGQLGVLGQDGWFHDDHRFHPMPASVFDSESCGLIGSAGYALTGTWDNTFASGIWLVGDCQYPAPKWARDAKLPVCPARDLRFVAYGLLGPNARAITTGHGTSERTMRTVGHQGTYLVVRPELAVLAVHGSGGGGPGLAGGGGPGSFPGATTAIYRDGRSCPSAEPGPDTCVLSGYTSTAPVGVHVRPVPMRVTVSRARPELTGSFNAVAQFRAPITVSSGALDYTFKATNPGVAFAFEGSLDRDVRRGEIIRWHVSIPACKPRANLTIYLNRSTATSQNWRGNAPAIATIATASVRLPYLRHVPWC